MEVSPGRTTWKTWLIGFAIGVAIVAALFGIVRLVSDDLRLVCIAGAVLLSAAAYLLRRRIDWVATILILLPSLLGFAFIVVAQVHPLWPTLFIWTASAFLILTWKKLGHTIGIIAALVLITFSGWFCIFYIPVQIQRALTRVDNRAAPRFSLEPISSGEVPSGVKPGKILVLDFFATWCAPCIAELPELEHLCGNLRTNRDIEFVLVGSNNGGDTVERVRAFVQRRHISMPVAFDRDHKTMDALGISGFPSLVVIDRAGRVRLIHQGYNSSETSFRHDLTQLLQSL